MVVKYANAYTEVYKILECLEEEEYEKIPDEFLQVIEENRNLIRENLFKTISTEYYKLYNVFSAYEVDGINIATKIKDEWIDDTTKECLEVIYDGQDKDVRIGQILNKLTIIANEHSVYVNNKVFNH